MATLLATIVFALFCLVADAARFKQFGGSLTSSMTLQFPTDNVIFKDVVISGSSTILTIDIGSMMTGSGGTLQVLLCGCTVTSGALVYVKGGSSALSRSLKLVIQNADVNGGGSLAFTGTMPTRSVLLLVNPSFNLATYSRSFAGIASSSSTISGSSYRVGILFASFSLATSSSFAISGGYFTGGTLSVPFWLDTSLTCTTQSIFSVQNTDIYSKRGLIAPGTISITSNSVMLWDTVYFESCTTNCMLYQNTVSISATSALVWSKVSADSINDVISFTASLSISSSSYWMIRGNVLTFVGGNKAIRVSSAVSVSSSSYVVMANNLFDSSPFSLTLTMSSSTSIAQCNSAGGSALLNTGSYGIGGLQSAFVCASCVKQSIGCFAAYTSSYTESTTCKCTCSGIGAGDWCLPAVVPSVKAGCLQTDSVTVSEEATQTITLLETASMSLSNTGGVTSTGTVSASKSRMTVQWTSSATTSRTEGSATEAMTHSVSQRTLTRRSASSEASTTDTLRPTFSVSASFEFATKTMTLSETASRTVTLTKSETTDGSATMSTTSEGSPTESLSPSNTPTVTQSLSVSPSNSSSPSQEAHSRSESNSDVPSLSHTISVSSSPAGSLSASLTCSLTDPPTVTPSGSVTSEPTASPTLEVTRTAGPSETRAVTLSNTTVATPSDTELLSASPTESWSLSASESLTTTPSVTPTKSDQRSATASISSSWCEWWDPPLNATSPLRVLHKSNVTMTIDYYSFSRHGCEFLLPDTGQWYVVNVSYGGISPTVLVTPREVAYEYNISVLKPLTMYHPQIDRDVLVELVFRCSVIYRTVWYTVMIPPSYAIAPYDAEQETMRAAAVLALVVTSTASCAFFATTSITLGVLMMCRPPEEVTEFSILPIAIGNEASKHVRGAIIGNVFTLVGGVVAVVGIVLLAAAGCNSRQTLSEEDETYLYPSKRKIIIRKRLGRDGGETELVPPPMPLLQLDDGKPPVNLRDVVVGMDAMDHDTDPLSPPPVLPPSTTAQQVAEPPERATIVRSGGSTHSRFFLEWSRVRVMSGYPLVILHPAVSAVLQPTAGAGLALYRMQASPSDNVLGSFAVLLAIGYWVFAFRTMRLLYIQMFGEFLINEPLPLWYWDEIMGAELRRRLGIYLKKKRRRIKKKLTMRQRVREEEKAAALRTEADNADDKFSWPDDAARQKEQEQKASQPVVPPEKLSSSASSLFVGLRLPWYAVVRLAACIVYGLAAGTPPIKTDVCTLQIWAIALSTIVHAVILLYFKPFWAPSEQYLSLANCLVILCMCGCLAVATSSEENQLVAVDGASVCLFLILGFAIVQGLMHFYLHHRRIWDVWKAIVRRDDIPEPPEPPPRAPASEHPSTASFQEETDEEEEEEEEESEDDFFVELRETEMLRRDEKRDAHRGGFTDLERIYKVDEGVEEEDDFFGMIAQDPLTRSMYSATGAFHNDIDREQDSRDDTDSAPPHVDDFGDDDALHSDHDEDSDGSHVQVAPTPPHFEDSEEDL